MCHVDIWGSNNAYITNGSQYKHPETEACLEYSRNMRKLLWLRKKKRARGNHRNCCQKIMEKLDFIGLMDHWKSFTLRWKGIGEF